MRIPFLVRHPREYSIEPLGPDSGAALAVLHREDFARPWTDGEFEQLIAQDTVFGFAGLETGKGKAGPVGFVLARLAAGEAELIELGANILEVDETNQPAIALYRRFGFREVGKRPRYYQSAEGQHSAALVMRRDLR